MSYKIFGIGLLGALIASTIYLGVFNRSVPASKISTLQISSNECIGIAENAVAGIVPIVEFQKLELEGKKASVVRRCMQDHGYYENPAWLNFSKPVAERNAKQQKISNDEAMENLKRSQMMSIKPSPSEPPFWISLVTKDK